MTDREAWVSLFDPEPTLIVSVRHLGEIREFTITESGTTMVCEAGRIEFSNSQFNSIRKTLTPSPALTLVRKANP